MKLYKKYKRGFISGMFDIFHIGHLDTLRLAKELCEYLIVAVGTDDFYRHDKKREPIMPYTERREIIASIRYVDEVVDISDLDKISAYHKYHFDVMFAGDDHEGEDVYIKATEELRHFGVETIYVKRRKMGSTAYRKYFKNVEKIVYENKKTLLDTKPLTPSPYNKIRLSA
jgi:glycerol-3-phosphate cytidylyltransferase